MIKNSNDCKQLLKYLNNLEQTTKRMREIVSKDIEELKSTNKDKEVLKDFTILLKNINKFTKKTEDRKAKEEAEKKKYNDFMTSKF